MTRAVLVFIRIIPTIIHSIANIIEVGAFAVLTLELVRTADRTVLSFIRIVATVIILIANVLLIDASS